MESDLETLRAVKARHSRTLLARPGVSGVGIEADPAGRLSLTIHLDGDQPHAREGLPDTLEGHPVTYLTTGPFLPREADST